MRSGRSSNFDRRAKPNCVQCFYPRMGIATLYFQTGRRRCGVPSVAVVVNRSFSIRGRHRDSPRAADGSYCSGCARVFVHKTGVPRCYLSIRAEIRVTTVLLEVTWLGQPPPVRSTHRWRLLCSSARPARSLSRWATTSCRRGFENNAQPHRHTPAPNPTGRPVPDAGSKAPPYSRRFTTRIRTIAHNNTRGSCLVPRQILTVKTGKQIELCATTKSQEPPRHGRQQRGAAARSAALP